ncbi:hypothetical protein ACFRAQ_34930 [Nocardia sp. NPDC056611]|uniref:hypothetical protein n=1 Tax=Nocardia sp. NPDC056611 TaxID=3345877 RepID=UPI00366D1181
MHDFMPNEMRNVRAHVDTVGMFTKGNKGQLGIRREAQDNCARCGRLLSPGNYIGGGEYQGRLMESQIRPGYCVKCGVDKSGSNMELPGEFPTIQRDAMHYADLGRRLAKGVEFADFLRSVPFRLRSQVESVSDEAFLRAIAERSGWSVSVRENADISTRKQKDSGDRRYGRVTDFRAGIVSIAVQFDSAGVLVKAQVQDLNRGHGLSTVIGRNRAAQVSDIMSGRK